MKTVPSYANFCDAYELNKAQVLSTTVTADLETPVSAMLKLAGEKYNCFLLESVEGGVHRGRYSIIGMDPDVVWLCNGKQAQTCFMGQDGEISRRTTSNDALKSLRDLVEQSKIDLPKDLPPMAAGLVGYLGYNTISLMEDIPISKTDSLQTPDGLFLRPKIMAIFDLVKDSLIIVTPVRIEKNVSADQAWKSAYSRLSAVVTAFGQNLKRKESEFQSKSASLTPESNTSKQKYLEIVEKAKDYILSGDIFQVVLSQRFKVPFTLPPFTLYRALRRTNPSPFLFFLNFKDFAVVGSSPEILVRMRDGKVTIRPLAGTRRRGQTQEKDRDLEQELLSDQKELAEHLMLLDLGRNDVGRVAKIGTVRVTEKMVIERYSHVMHISSNVEGEIDIKKGAMDALAAGFPAGTVSGAPKIRAMEIIDELETEKRGIYAGTVGYFSANGSMDTCILLRTAIVKDGYMYIQAGAGIVADSNPETEYEECINKAAAVIKAAEEAFLYA
jgi:anthranilate synthase component 1